MKKFIALYSGGLETTDQKEIDASMKRWTDWFGKLGGSVAEVGNPFGESKTLSKAGVKDGQDGNPSNGYSIFQAASLQDASALLKGSPILGEGGKVHLFELIPM